MTTPAWVPKCSHSFRISSVYVCLHVATEACGISEWYKSRFRQNETSAASFDLWHCERPNPLAYNHGAWHSGSLVAAPVVAEIKERSVE
jgi:hypothetical protein